MRLTMAVLVLILASALLSRPVSSHTCYNTTWVTIARSGDKLGNGTFGQPVDRKGNPIVRQLSQNETWETPLSPALVQGWGRWEWDSRLAAVISNNPDFPSIHEVGGKAFLINHFEDPQPSTPYITQLDIGPDGSLSAASTAPVDTSDPRVQGLWFMCRGEKTPWGTHIGAEEYPPDCREYEELLLPCPGGAPNGSLCGYEESSSAASLKDFARFYGFYSGPEAANSSAMAFAANRTNLQTFKQDFSCYNYGAHVEISIIDPKGTPQLIKWRTLGRLSGETAVIMPDNKTVYLSDDSDNGVFVKFVADRPSDLFSGTLYAAEFKNQPNHTDRFSINWIELGHGDQTSLETLARDTGTSFSSILEVADLSSSSGGSCPEGYSPANTYTPLALQKRGNSSSSSAYVECLRIKPGMEAAAAFLETRRTAALKGATTEWQKMEGLTFSPERSQLYLALTRVTRGMLAGPNKYDALGPDHLRFAENPCGIVMTLDYDAGNFSAYQASVLLAGDNATGTYEANTCDVGAISGPDNLYYFNHNLLVAEDTEHHLNNLLSAYNFNTGALSRVLSAPAYAEVTGQRLSFAGGRAYLTLALQHPGQQEEGPPTSAEQARSFRGYVGYLGPLPLEAVAPGVQLDFGTAALQQPAAGDEVYEVLSVPRVCAAT